MEKSTLKSNIAKPSIPNNQTANSQKSTNIPPEYFNSDNSTEDQASQEPYFTDKQESDSQDTENYPNFIRRSIWNCGKLMSA